jgi:hypothetical protein
MVAVQNLESEARSVIEAKDQSKNDNEQPNKAASKYRSTALTVGRSSTP